MTRGQLASFVARALHAAEVPLPPDPPRAFDDTTGSPHQRSIDQLAALGVVRGRADGTFSPASPVTRAEMATFLVRLHDLVVATPLEGRGNVFADDAGSVHEASIDKVAAAGLAGGVGASRFAPGEVVARGQLATFLARTLDLFVEVGAATSS